MQFAKVNVLEHLHNKHLTSNKMVPDLIPGFSSLDYLIIIRPAMA
jgi:hypothetical protein